MNRVYTMKSLEPYLLMCKKAIANGKKPGDSMQEEFDEVVKEHPDWFEYLGETQDDIDLIAGNLREKGKKVLNLNEISRRAEKEGSDNA